MSAFKPANNDKIVTDDQSLLQLFPKSVDQLKPPKVRGNTYLLNGEIREFTESTDPVSSVITAQDGKAANLTTFARCNKEIAMQALDAAYKAFDKGRGEWPRMSMQERARRMSAFLEDFKRIKDQLVELLMWDICKSKKDATDEVDRTIDYIQDTVTHAVEMDKESSKFETTSGVAAQVKRLPIGVVLASGPFNYPLNECYTTFIPALITGNTVILRIPRNGASPHFPTLPLFQKHFPPGSINILSGSGREIMTPLMEDGRIDFLAFIGRHKSANALVKDHPAANRLHTILQMDAKDCAIVLKDADVEYAATQCASGAFSFNGQRCTALKLIWVHESIAEAFVKKVVEKVDAMKVGMPWDEDVKITPLCEPGKPDELKEMLEDALSKGAHILNRQGGRFGKALVAPTVVGPVTKDMKLWQEEQFGPIMPITSFASVDEPLAWLADNHFGLQSAVFGYDAQELARVVDTMAFQVGRVNVNSADKRGPDVLPFVGKKDSGMGVTNAREAVRGFTIETILATSVSDERNVKAIKGLEGVSNVWSGTQTISK